MDDIAKGAKEIFAANMKYHLERKGKNQKDLAEYLGVSTSTVSDWAKGSKYPRVDKMQRMADWFGIRMSELTTERAAAHSIPRGFQPMPEMELVPRVGRIACGTPILAEENIEGLDAVPKYLHADYTLLCVGDSMAPKFLDGDIVCIRKQPEVENGEVAAVRIGDEATLKQVFLRSDYVELRPLNTEYESIIRSREQMNDVFIEGKAVGLIRAV